MIRIARLLVCVSLALSLNGLAFAQTRESLQARPLQLAMGEVELDDHRAPGLKQPPRSENAKPDAAAPIVWTPPVDGAPRVRVAGGVRGTTALPTPTALVPEHVGLTTRGAPSFFWHIDAGIPEGTRLFFTLVEEEEGLPLVEVELAPPADSGIQRVRLSDHAIELGAGTTYAWSIALVPDMQHRSADVVAIGYVERVPGPGPGSLDAQRFAAEGLWYDALEVLSDAVDESPGTDAPRSLRRSLLRQAGLWVGVE